MIKRRAGLLAGGPRLSRKVFLRGGAAGLATVGMAPLLRAFDSGYATADAAGVQSASTQAQTAPVFTDVGITTHLVSGGANVVHLGALMSDGNLYYTQATREKHASAPGPWAPFTNVKAASRSDPGTIVDVDLATGPDGMQVVVATSDGGVWHTVRFGNGSWQVFGNVKGAAGNDPGRVVAVTAAEVPIEDTHVGVVTADGGLLHTIRFGARGWTRFRNVKATGAGNPGFIIDADFASPGFDLHAVALTRDGGIWHTIRQLNIVFGYHWSRFASVLREAGPLASVGNITAGGHPFRLDVGAVRESDGHLFSTSRNSAGHWSKPWTDASEPGDLANVAAADFALDNNLYLNAVVVTGNGELWYSNEHDGRWQAFTKIA